MKTATKMLMAAIVLLAGAVGTAWANDEEDKITVTFVINTSTVADTLTADNVVQLRGNLNGDDSGDINWGSSSVVATNIGGDYWELPLELSPGDVLTYKFWVGFTTEDGAGFDGGWEFGDNKVYTVPADAEEDIRLDVHYINGVPPFEASEENEVAIHFRVNVGAQVSLGEFDPENPAHRVGVRGDVNSETGQVTYKYVIDKGGDDVAWEGGSDKILFRPEADSTVKWTFFDNRRPPAGELVDATLQFSVNVSLLEELGYFNRAIGDQVKLRGTFNNFAEGEMTYVEALDLWTASVEITEEVGATVKYKYFIKWDESRFDSESSNFIPNLDGNNGWEEPGLTGGSDRVYVMEDGEIQAVPGDFGLDTAFFNSMPEQAIIREQNIVDGTDMSVTFRVDMTDALTHSEPFNPAEDSLFLILQTPFFALDQGIPEGGRVLEPDVAQEIKDKVLFTATGEGNWYELTLELELPTENHIGFVLAYVNPSGEIVQNGGGFDAGRRYYRYITPAGIDGDNVFWNSENTLADIVWKEEDLDFEDPPSYGLGDDEEAGKYFFLSDENGKVRTLDWGSTLLVLEKEPRLSENSRNYFYSGTLYPMVVATSIDEETTGVNAFKLNQNFPNPFNPSTLINFTLPQASDVKLTVYNVLGQRVATLVNGSMTSGAHTVRFDANNLASGVYFYRLEAGSFVQQRSMTLIK